MARRGLLAETGGVCVPDRQRYILNLAMRDDCQSAVRFEMSKKGRRMNSNRKTAIIVGVFFIAATVTAILGLFVFIGPVLDDADYLTNVSANENQVVIGVLLELITAGAVAGTAIALFPIFKRHIEALALGYVGGRIFEGAIIIVGAVAALLLLTLSREYAAASPGASYFQTSGALLLAQRDWTLLLGPMIVLGPNALMLNYLFYQSRLVPRFLSVWGLIAAPLVLAAGLLRVFSLIASVSTISVLLVLPIALFEMVLAVWLIVKGFSSPAIAYNPA